MLRVRRRPGTLLAFPRRKEVDVSTHVETHRRRGRWITGSVAVIALAVAGCSSSSGSGAGGSAATTSSAPTPATTSSAPTPVTATSAKPVTLLRPLKALKQPSARCGAPHTKATLVRFHAADGTGLDGVMVGSGSVGVVLAHEYDNDLCGAWPFANYLAKRGYRVLAIDMRCFGRSACPQGDAAGRVVDDLLAAVAELRHRGVRKVALVGSSMGGSAALIAATRVQPPVDAVVELSGEANPTSLIHIPLNAQAAVQQLTVPAMFVVANLDQYTTVEETRAMYQADKTADKRLLLLPSQYDGFHGWQVLTEASGAFSPTATKITAFITAHTRS
jgi:dienelactone hydrolase